MTAPDHDPADPADPIARRGAAPRSPRDPAATAAVVLVVLGLLLLAAWRVGTGDSGQSFAEGATPPSSFTLEAGKEYSLSVRGGVKTTQNLLPDPSSLSCSITPLGGGRVQLSIAAEPTTTKATDRIGRFIAPVTGTSAIECDDLPAVFVDDADSAGFDWSGLCLLLASVCLVIGLPLLFSVLRRHFATGREPYPAA